MRTIAFQRREAGSPPDLEQDEFALRVQSGALFLPDAAVGIQHFQRIFFGKVRQHFRHPSHPGERIRLAKGILGGGDGIFCRRQR